MLPLVAGLEVAILIGIVVLVLKKNSNSSAEPSIQAIGENVVRLDGKSDRLEASVRTGIQEIRGDLTAGMNQSREEVSRSSEQTRKELTGIRELIAERLQALSDDSAQRHIALLETLNSRLMGLQQEISGTLSGAQTTQSSETLKMKETVEATLGQLGRDIRESSRQLTEEVKARLHEVGLQLTALTEKNEKQQDSLRLAVEGKLEKIQESNAAKLEEMRATVDEKLHSTLEERLKSSFGQVAERLESVHKGLGEMKDLAVGVGDLKRVLTNVKTRGSIAEVQCGMLLEQILSPGQYIKDAVVKDGSRESVEWAVRIPSGESSEILLPIDAKFPKEDWERLEDAMQRGEVEEIAAGRKRLAATVRFEAKKICDKYISPPATTTYALMYLGTENLYAEVIRIDGLVDDIQREFDVCIAGPANFAAILSSLQMGFRTVAIQKKGAEVWKVLGAAKSEFQKFGGLMSKVEKQVGTVQNTLKEIRGKTTTINRTLKDVGTLDMQPVESSLLLDLGNANEDSVADESEEELEMAASDGESE